ncbi:MAG: outer membrane beta-barrel protein [Raineya sp.]|nr:outer membrane beta-barrel protein [Raineya sp.]
MKGLKNFEHIWQEKFLYASVSPSDRVWEMIALQIDEKRQQRRRKIIAWWAAAMLALFLGDGELLYQGKGLLGKWLGEKQEIIQNFSIHSANNEKINFTPAHSLQSQKNNFDELNFIAQTPETAIIQEPEKVENIIEEKKEEVLPKENKKEEVEEEAVGTPKVKRWWIQRGLQVGGFQQYWHYTPTPLLMGRMLTNPDEQIMLKREENLLKEIASYRTLCTWGAGMDLGYQLNQHWFVSGGFQYRKTYAIFQSYSQVPILAKLYGNVPNLDAQTPPASHVAIAEGVGMVEGETEQALAIPEPAPETEITYRHTTETINIPLKVGFQVQKNKWRYAVAVGAEANFLVNNTFSSENATYSSVFQKVNRIQYAGVAELQIGYQLTPKLYLQASPSFRNALTPLFRNASPLQLRNQQTWLLGLGMLWRL